MSNLNSLKKSDLIALVEQLERNAEDDRRRIGVMMYEANTMSQRLVELEAEVESLQVDLSIAQSDLEDQSKTADEYDAELTTAKEVIEVQAARIKLLSQKVAAKPSAPKRPAPKRPAPKPQVPAQPVASPEAHKALREFGALTPAQRSAVVKFTGAKVVNLGNILEIQAKWHSRKSA